MPEILIGNIKGERGDPGQGFKVLDYYATAEELASAVTNPSVGDAYGVGSERPYDIYIYSTSKGWVNNGALHGVQFTTGSYVGTGFATVRLTFPFEPKYVFIIHQSDNNYRLDFAHLFKGDTTFIMSYDGTPSIYPPALAWDGCCVEWIPGGSGEPDVRGGLNSEGVTYNYVALG